MAIISLRRQEFSQRVITALHGADNGPVFITDCGVPTHVLLSLQILEHR